MQPLVGERRAEYVAQQALARRLVLGAGNACRVQVESQLLHDQRAHRRRTRAISARELHGRTAAHLGAGRRQSRDRGGGELGQHGVALGHVVADIEGFGQ